MQRLAPQLRRRPRPAPLAAPRALRAARHRRVHARHRPAAAGRRREDLGTRPAHGRQQHVQLLPRPARQHRRVHDRAGAPRRGHLAPAACTTSATPRSPTSGAPRTRWTSSSPRSRSTTRTRVCSWPRRSDARSRPESGGHACSAGVVAPSRPARARRAARTVLDLVRAGLPAALEAGAAALERAAPCRSTGVRLLPPLRGADRARLRDVRGARRGHRRGHGVPSSPEWYDAPTFYFTNPYALVGAHDDVAVPPGCSGWTSSWRWPW